LNDSKPNYFHWPIFFKLGTKNDEEIVAKDLSR
jgi:hypothetical protein